MDTHTRTLNCRYCGKTRTQRKYRSMASMLNRSMPQSIYRKTVHNLTHTDYIMTIVSLYPLPFWDGLSVYLCVCIVTMLVFSERKKWLLEMTSQRRKPALTNKVHTNTHYQSINIPVAEQLSQGWVKQHSHTKHLQTNLSWYDSAATMPTPFFCSNDVQNIDALTFPPGAYYCAWKIIGLRNK